MVIVEWWREVVNITTVDSVVTMATIITATTEHAPFNTDTIAAKGVLRMMVTMLAVGTITMDATAADAPLLH